MDLTDAEKRLIMRLIGNQLLAAPCCPSCTATMVSLYTRLVADLGKTPEAASHTL